MRFIEKGTPPDCLVELRNKPDANYGQLSSGGCKQLVREALVEEQRALCCYCMQRITASDSAMKIEHWSPQNGQRDNDLGWSNLLGACRGNEEGRQQPAQDRHCDTGKGDQSISIRPTEPSCEAQLEYKVDGTIASSNPEFQRDLAETLNLNVTALRAGRREALNRYLREMERQHAGSWSRELCLKELERLAHRAKRLPFDGIIVAKLRAKAGG